MLDLQRQRSDSPNTDSVNFTRLVFVLHVLIGALAVGLLICQELVSASLIALIWYLLSIGLMVGMCRMLQWCRIILGWWLIMGGLAALAYISSLPPIAPNSADDQAALAQRLLPLLFSTVVILDMLGGSLFLLSQRVLRATTRGFTLWANPRRLQA